MIAGHPGALVPTCHMDSNENDRNEVLTEIELKICGLPIDFLPVYDLSQGGNRSAGTAALEL